MTEKKEIIIGPSLTYLLTYVDGYQGVVHRANQYSDSSLQRLGGREGRGRGGEWGRQQIPLCATLALGINHCTQLFPLDYSFIHSLHSYLHTNFLTSVHPILSN